MQLSRSSRRFRQSALAAAASVGLFISSSALAQTNGTWAVDVGSTGGNWTSPANWVGGNVAGSGGVATFNTLPAFTTGPLAFIQDSAAPIQISKFEFNTYITSNFRRPTGNSTNSFTLTGGGEIAVNLPVINSSTTSQFGQQFQIALNGNVGLRKTGPGTASLFATANNFIGDINIDGGILCLRTIGDTGLGDVNNKVFINNGGEMRFNAAITTARTFTVTGTGSFNMFSGGNAGVYSGNLAGSGTLVRSGSGTTTFTANNSFAGTLNDGQGIFALSGAGALPNVSSLLMRSTFILDNTGVVGNNNTNRLGDTSTMTLYGSTLSMLGNANAASSETVGTTNFSRGTGIVSVTPGAGQSATMALGNVGRDNGGAAFFRGDNLGNAPAAGVTNITFSATPTMVGGIIPWAYGGASSAATPSAATNGFVTYGANGVRPLNLNTEYAVDALPASVTTDNVRLTLQATPTGPGTINSLLITSGTGIATSSTSTLSITSGAVLNLSSAAAINVPMDFGSNEAIINSANSSGGLVLNSIVVGSGGLTKQGGGTVLFNNNNRYTGTTIIANGVAGYFANVGSNVNSPFGKSSSAIVLGGGGQGNAPTVLYGGAGTATFDRDLFVDGRNTLNSTFAIPAFGAIAGSSVDMNGDIFLNDSPILLTGGAGSTITLNGNITGNGLFSDASASGANIVIKGNNTFTGGAEISGAILQIGTDNAFGSGMVKLAQTGGGPTLLSFGGAHTITNDVAYPTIASATFWTIGGSNDLTFTGPINLGGGPFNHIINNTGVTTYAGQLHTGGFSKTGAGTLVLSGNNIQTGTTNVAAGALRAQTSTALGTPNIGTNVATNAALELNSNALTSEPVTMNGSGIGGTGAVRNTSGNNSLGAITMAGSSTVGVDGGSLKVGNIGFTTGTPDLTKVGGGLLIADRYRPNNLNVNVGTASVTPGHSAAKLSTIALLTIPGGATPTATLDLGDNDLLATNTTVASAVALVNYARHNKLWDRPGISSSVAAGEYPHIHTLGVMSGAEYNSVNASPFDGVSPAAGNTLIKFALYGDTDFDDAITPTDYGRLNNGYANTLSGWTNGDFNLDGTVDAVDYALIDIANTYLAGDLVRAGQYLDGTDPSETGMGDPSLQLVEQHLAQFGQPYVNAFLDQVPEPTSVAGIGLLSAALTMRRRRNVRARGE